MRLIHVQPPPGKRTGGLETAIAGLELAVRPHFDQVERGNAREWKKLPAGPTLFHFHALWEMDYPRLSHLCRRAGQPYIVSPHGMLEPWAWRHKRLKKWPYFYLRERRHLAHAACLLATGDPEGERLRHLFPDTRVEVLPLGAETPPAMDRARVRQQLGWREGEFVVLYLSRIHAKKGLHLLIEAIEHMGEAAENLRLVVVGDGNDAYVQHCQSLAHRLTATVRQEWLGAVWGHQRWKYFFGADAFCLPSFSENFGVAILEALQAGTRVITTTATPWTTWRDARELRAVNPDPVEIAMALRAYRAETFSPSQSARLAEETQARFSWEVLAGRYAALYRELLGSIAS